MTIINRKYDTVRNNVGKDCELQAVRDHLQQEKTRLSTRTDAIKGVSNKWEKVMTVFVFKAIPETRRKRIKLQIYG